MNIFICCPATKSLQSLSKAGLELPTSTSFYCLTRTYLVTRHYVFIKTNTNLFIWVIHIPSFLLPSCRGLKKVIHYQHTVYMVIFAGGKFSKNVNETCEILMKKAIWRSTPRFRRCENFPKAFYLVFAKQVLWTHFKTTCFVNFVYSQSQMSLICRFSCIMRAIINF